MNEPDPIVIVGAKRTPIGNFQGELQTLTASELGGYAIEGALEQAQVSADDIDEVIMGCVLPAGQGQAPARQASLKAGIPTSAGCSTVNKMCGSGMKAVMLAHDLIKAGSNDIMVAGGMESMTNAPYLLPKARAGYRLGHGQVFDHMFLDGLEDAYDKGQLMGVFADATAKEYKVDRKTQDDFAIESVHRAQMASELGLEINGIIPITVRSRKSEVTIDSDEGPRTARVEKIPQLKPAFAQDGTVTAANSSSISDGAAAIILMRESEAKKRGLTPLAKIIAHRSHAHEPAWFTTAPVNAIEKVLAAANWNKDDVDLYEINEAFAIVSLVAMQQLDLPHDKVNIFGGACVVGHPIGATGTRILVTLINALKHKGLTRGVAALCIGGGEATAMAIEVCS